MKTFKFEIMTSSQNTRKEIMSHMKKINFKDITTGSDDAPVEFSATISLKDEDAAYDMTLLLLDKYETEIHDIDVQVK